MKERNLIMLEIYVNTLRVIVRISITCIGIRIRVGSMECLLLLLIGPIIGVVRPHNCIRVIISIGKMLLKLEQFRI